MSVQNDTTEEATTVGPDHPLENMARAQRAYTELGEAYKVYEEQQAALRAHRQSTEQLRAEAQARHDAKVKEFAESIRHELDTELAEVTKDDASLTADLEGAQETYYAVADSLIERGFFNRSQFKRLGFPSPPVQRKDAK